MDKAAIDEFLATHNIEVKGTYTIAPTGEISVDGDVTVFLDAEIQMPIRFSNVTGNVDIRGFGIATLEGWPTTVGGNYAVTLTKITNFVGAPRVIGGSFASAMNGAITSLAGFPAKIGYAAPGPNVVTIDYSANLENVGLLAIVLSEINFRTGSQDVGLSLGKKNNEKTNAVKSILSKYVGRPNPGARQGAAIAASAALIKAGFRNHAKM